MLCFFAQRARAARCADSRRCSGESFLARVRPPIRPVSSQVKLMSFAAWSAMTKDFYHDA